MTTDAKQIRAQFQEALNTLSPEVKHTATGAILRSGGIRLVAASEEKVVLSYKYESHKEKLGLKESCDIIAKILVPILHFAPTIYYVPDSPQFYTPEELKAEADEQEAQRHRWAEEQRIREQNKRLALEHEKREQTKDGCLIPMPAQETHRLDKFEILPGNEKAHQAALSFVDSMLDEPSEASYTHHFLTFCGEPGTGKTHLAIGAQIRAMAMTDYQRPTVYWHVEELLERLRASFGEDAGVTAREIIRSTKDAYLLVLDDLGAQKSTEWAIAKLDSIIDYRYIHCMTTIFTTNLRPQQLPTRIASRLQEGIVVVLTPGDYRLLKAKRRAMADKT